MMTQLLLCLRLGIRSFLALANLTHEAVLKDCDELVKPVDSMSVFAPSSLLFAP